MAARFYCQPWTRLEKGLQGTEFPQFACEKYRGGNWMLSLIETPHHKSAVDKTCDFGETHTARSQPRNQARAANINPNNRGFAGSQIQVEQLSHNGTGTPRIIDKKGLYCTTGSSSNVPIYGTPFSYLDHVTARCLPSVDGSPVYVRTVSCVRRVYCCLEWIYAGSNN